MQRTVLAAAIAAAVWHLLIILQITHCSNAGVVDAGLDKLYRKFYSDRSGYKYARPVHNVSEPVIMYMNLSLVQLMDVDEKNQIISLNMWVYQEWHDPFFHWRPSEFGEVNKLILPSDALWTPDVVLYSNTGTNWDLSATTTKVHISNTGNVVWKPPITYQSSCDINVEFFPFDTQDCKLKMGTWTYHGMHIDLRHTAQKADDIRRNRRNFDNCESDVNYAMDLSEYIESSEWDLMQVKASRNIVKYACCVEPYLDITFLVRFRRQPLFYGTNLISPCIAISLLTSSVFYLPADSQEKMTMSTFILLALTVFLLLVFDLTPPTSLVVPLITKYLLFTMILISLSLMISTVVLSVRFRPTEIHRVPAWAKLLFLEILPGPLFMDKPDIDQQDSAEASEIAEEAEEEEEEEEEMDHEMLGHSDDARSILAALRGVKSIARRIEEDEIGDNAEEEWKYVALILDRIFLFCFTLSNFVGIFGIFMQAPTITTSEQPLRADDFHNYLMNLSVTRKCGLGYQPS